MRRRTSLAALVVAAAMTLGLAPAGSAPTTLTPAADDWLGVVNAYRATAGLDPVVADAAWVAGAEAHSAYTVRNGVLGHSEDPTKPGYSQGGHDAGASGNVMATSATDLTAAYAIGAWMAGPFHAAGILDPRLERSAYGQHVDPAGSYYRAAATLDVIRGLDVSATWPDAPIVFPGDGSAVPLTSYRGGEWPDPLTPCDGYAAPTGLPVTVLAGRGNSSLGAHSITAEGEPVEHCAFDATTYTNPDAATQDYARSGLDSRGVVVLVPRRPLQVGTAYTVTLTVAGERVTSTFTPTTSGFRAATSTPAPADPGPAPLPVPEPAPEPVAAAVPDDLKAACEEGHPSSFSDVGGGNVHRAAIDCVGRWEIASGVGGGRFAPDGKVTRAQMAAFLVRLLDRTDRPLPTAARDRFTDDARSPHQDAINRLAAAGITSGTGDGRFLPAARVTRAQMASFLVAAVEWAAGEPLAPGAATFEDLAWSPHRANVERAAAAGLVSGRATDTFAPGHDVSRAQVATFLSRALAHLIGAGASAGPAS